MSTTDIGKRKNNILAFLGSPGYVPMREKDLCVMMMVEKEERGLFKQCLQELLDEGLIMMNKRGKYRLPESEIYKGIFSSGGKGFGFVHVEELGEDFFINDTNVNNALNGDTVLIDPFASGKRRGKSREASVVEIVEHANSRIVGTYISKGKYGYIEPDSNKIDRQVLVLSGDQHGAREGDKVIVSVTSYGDRNMGMRGEIIEILGHTGDPGVDILAIVKACGIPVEFPEEVLAEAKKVRKKVIKAETQGREDLRDVAMVTIDGEDTKDIDDAVSLTVLDDGWELGVHIADVSHYVKEGSALDREALARGTSCYPVDRVVPMLPVELSNGICSLDEKVDRLALSCFMTISKKGEIIDHRFARTVINTNHRMTYTDVNKIITFHDKKLMKKYEDVSDMLLEMHEAAKMLRSIRKKRGSIDFDLPQTQITLDSDGRPVEIGPYERNNATRLIEDFMLAANGTVAEHFFWADVPFVYRIHEKPDTDRIRRLSTFITNFGYGIKMKNDGIHPKELQKLLAGVTDTPEESLIARLTLRSMQRAKYSTDCAGHFGLALKYYCHFTSPIRRYPDLQIHRIIKEYISGGFDETRAEHYRMILGDVCIQSCIRERAAEDAERDADRLKKAEYMKEHVGEVFEGVISGITNWGLFVELPNTVEGLVHISNLEGDNYVYNDDTYELVGRKTGRRFCLGARIRVICNSADTLSRTVDFVLADDVSALDNDIY